MIEKIPVLTVSGANRNRNLIKLEVTSPSSRLTSSYLQTEARPGGEGSPLWARLGTGSEGGDVVRGHHQECWGRPG